MMESVIPLFLHLDQNMSLVVHEYGMWTYFILFCIIFFETGIVIMPFLPGDSILFVAGAAAASGILDIQWLLIAIVLGAVIGDTVNYWIGNYIGLHVFLERFPNLVKKEYVDQDVRVLRKIWRYDYLCGTVLSHYPDICTLSCRSRVNAVPAVSCSTISWEGLHGLSALSLPVTTLVHFPL